MLAWGLLFCSRLEPQLLDDKSLGRLKLACAPTPYPKAPDGGIPFRVACASNLKCLQALCSAVGQEFFLFGLSAIGTLITQPGA